jgi:hypothetical protein
MARIPSTGGGGAEATAFGWVKVADITVPSGVVLNKVWKDPPANTILDECTVTNLNIGVEILAAFPKVSVNGVDATLTQSADGGHYAGTVDITLTGSGIVQVESETPEGVTGAWDRVTVTYDAPPELLTLSFTGGYPGSQTELKAGDTFQLQGTTDKNADAVQILDVGAMTSSLETFASGTSFTVTGTIADRGTVAQLLSAQVQARDAVTGALGPARDTNAGAGGVDGTDVLNLNNLYPSGTVGVITYPGIQAAIKAVEGATVNHTATDFDLIVYSDPTGVQIGIANPATFEAAKAVTGLGSGLFNDSAINFRYTMTRNANGAITVVDGVVVVADVAPVITVSVPAARLRSGGNHGTSAQDYEVTISSDQPLLNAPSLGPDPGGNRGTFQGAGFVGGPSVWTRDIRIDETVPDEKGTFAFAALVATGLAGLIQNTIGAGSAYTLGGFVARTLNFASFTADSTETVALADETKLVSGSFGNGNPGVRQPFGTADTTDAGKEGWFAPTAASGAVQIHMLHSPTVAANSVGVTLASVEEQI